MIVLHKIFGCMGDRINIGGRVRAARRAQELNQAELALQLHLDQSQISRIERGKCAIDADRLPEFSAALGVETAYFYQQDMDVNQIFRVD
jgi:transcriptional regulator with XRE-family HTH domain